jgi:hypothetical protein
LIVRCSPGIPFSKYDHFLPGTCDSTRIVFKLQRNFATVPFELALRPHPKGADP